MTKISVEEYFAIAGIPAAVAADTGCGAIVLNFFVPKSHCKKSEAFFKTIGFISPAFKVRYQYLIKPKK